MTHWTMTARAAIIKADCGLPENARLDERTKAIDDAYPFGIRAHHPYKVWLRERARYLTKYGYQKRGARIVESPLERAIRRSSEAAQ